MINFGEKETFIENYERLKSSRKMAELYGCSKSCILNHAKRIGYNNSNHKEIKITNVPIEEVIAEYEQLKSAEKVGIKYGCSGTAVLNYLKQNNYTPKNFQAKLADVSKEDFIAKYEELQSTTKMAQYYNCSKTSILNHSKKIGYTFVKKSDLTKEQKEKIIDSYQTSSSTELAKEYGVSRGIITKIWHDKHLSGKKVENPKTTIKDITGQTFGYWTVLEKTNNRSSSGTIMWRCQCICGTEKEISGNSLRNGTSLSCGCKNISRGNEKISKILLEHGIPFKREYKFMTCIDQKELPFDFYVNDSYLIEFDGIQHYKNSLHPNSWNTPEKVAITQYHDKIKNEWCLKNKIPLIRIPYTQLNKISIEDLKPETSKYLIMPTIN